MSDYNDNISEASDSAKASFNTVGHLPAPRLMHTFSARMALSYALTAIMTAFTLSAVLAITWEDQFQSYTRQNIQRLAEQTAQNIGNKYEDAGAWSYEVLDYARYASNSSSDIGVQVIDSDGKVLYDDTWSLSKRTTTVSNSNSTAVPPSADSVVSSSIVTSSGEYVGTVSMWAFGSDALITKSDAAFRTNSYTAILIAAGVAVLIASVIGAMTSRNLTRPIKVITSTAAQIRNGDLTARTNMSGDDEIGRLGEIFDGMATELERDIKFEHRLTSDVAHELRTPLMAMLATVEAMQDGVLPADDEHFETVASEVRRLSRLVDAMLHLSRIENGTSALKVARTDMVYLVKSLVSMQERLFAEKGLRLRFDDKTPDHECFADVDGDLIREAVTNIMSNAMRYTPEGGWVVVGIERDRLRGNVLISVRDTGIGIAKEDVPRVFSRFWRSDASRERVSGGLGVGLALTKEIIDKHNGTISVESELGKGTTFTLVIPIAHDSKMMDAGRE